MIYPLAFFLPYRVIILARFKAHCSAHVETTFDKDFLQLNSFWKQTNMTES